MPDGTDHLLADGLDMDVFGIGSARPYRPYRLIQVRARNGGKLWSG
jgi:hypothetical protein